ncbi:hypothetical protein HPB50_009196 [Hyalomma asiaticum]|uniref:Uncharacterized protein n=1 Tax=Hyalomma asiaticum TaxID=266040 RepID=A0ACB7SD23_HYAAI|nr:hypothetical protein HPB50_009196 [Hyalomma asiaticum]
MVKKRETELADYDRVSLYECACLYRAMCPPVPGWDPVAETHDLATGGEVAHGLLWGGNYRLATLKEKGLLSVGTARLNRLPGCSLKTDAALKKSSRGSFDVATGVCNNTAAVKWLDNNWFRHTSVANPEAKFRGGVQSQGAIFPSKHQVVTVPLPDDNKDYFTFQLPNFHPNEKTLERPTPINGSLRRFTLLMEFDILFKCKMLNHTESRFSNMFYVLYETGREEEIAALSTTEGLFQTYTG